MIKYPVRWKYSMALWHVLQASKVMMKNLRTVFHGVEDGKSTYSPPAWNTTRILLRITPSLPE